ncbi:MAG TPA: ATP-binding protein [Opitutaceae bacterium]|nr:ATP-binding protein [Opitutaceae bacterium]
MLRTRLYLGLLPLLLLLMAMGGYALFTCRELSRSVEVTLAANYRAMLATEEMKEAATLMDSALNQTEAGDALETRAQFAGQRARFERNLHEQSITAAGTPRAAPLEAVDAAFLTQVQADETFLREGSLSRQVVHRTTAVACFNTLRALETLAEYDHGVWQAELARAGRATRTTIKLLLGAMSAAILLSLFLSYRLSRSLLRPIRALTSSAVALGEGALDREVPILSRDELGELARAFNTMAAKLRAFREATTAKVLRAQRTMEATLTSTPDPVFVVSRSGEIELRNPAAEILAATPEIAQGLPEPLRQPLAEVLASGNHYLPTGYDRVVVLRIGREDRHYLPRILAVGDTLTGFGGAAILLQDVTKFRLLDDAKNNLVGTVSHELKTPLTGLRMAVYLLLEQNLGQLSSAQRELLETARDDADRLLRILNDLLDLSRLEAGATALNRTPERVDELLAAIIAEIRPVVEGAGQRIVVSIARGMDRVSVDRDRVRHVFINLLTNASKYSPEGSEIVLYAEPTPDGFAKFGVRDRGSGIPPESLPHVFDKFYRVPGQAKKGAGLGLAIAREIVVAHGGSIACASTPGAGSDFHFLLPGGLPAAA